MVLAHLCTPASFAFPSPTAAVPTPVMLFGVRIDRPAVLPAPTSRPYRLVSAPAAAVPRAPLWAPAFKPFGVLPSPAAAASQAPATKASALVPAPEVVVGPCKIIGPAILTGDPRLDCVPEHCFQLGGQVPSPSDPGQMSPASIGNERTRGVRCGETHLVTAAAKQEWKALYWVQV